MPLKLRLTQLKARLVQLAADLTSTGFYANYIVAAGQAVADDVATTAGVSPTLPSFRTRSMERSFSYLRFWLTFANSVGISTNIRSQIFVLGLHLSMDFWSVGPTASNRAALVDGR